MFLQLYLLIVLLISFFSVLMFYLFARSIPSSLCMLFAVRSVRSPQIRNKKKGFFFATYALSPRLCAISGNQN